MSRAARDLAEEIHFPSGRVAVRHKNTHYNETHLHRNLLVSVQGRHPPLPYLRVCVTHQTASLGTTGRILAGSIRPSAQEEGLQQLPVQYGFHHETGTQTEIEGHQGGICFGSISILSFFICIVSPSGLTSYPPDLLLCQKKFACVATLQ